MEFLVRLVNGRVICLLTLLLRAVFVTIQSEAQRKLGKDPMEWMWPWFYGPSLRFGFLVRGATHWIEMSLSVENSVKLGKRPLPSFPLPVQLGKLWLITFGLIAGIDDEQSKSPRKRMETRSNVVTRCSLTKKKTAKRESTGVGALPWRFMRPPPRTRHDLCFFFVFVV